MQVRVFSLLVVALLVVAVAFAEDVIVKLKPDVIEGFSSSGWNFNEDAITHTYWAVFHGVALKGLTAQEVYILSQDDRVEYVVPDDHIPFPDGELEGLSTLQVQAATSVLNTTERIQLEPTNWGLDRIDDRVGLDRSYEYQYTGSGVDIYIMDSGINNGHIDFGGRVSSDCYTAIAQEGCIDTNGHGSHVAAIAGGIRAGVAKESTIYNVKIGGTRGSSVAFMLGGLEWILARRLTDSSRAAVLNLSLRFSESRALIDAVRALIDSGVSVVVAAGNEGFDACNIVLPNISDTISVGATGPTDARIGNSNYGSCVDIFAPGSRIFSADYQREDEFVARTGTSMSSPMVAGVAALYLEANPTWTPAEVKKALLNDATRGRLTGIGEGSPNLLLFSGNVMTVNRTSSPSSVASDVPTLAASTQPSFAASNVPSHSVSNAPTPATTAPTREPVEDPLVILPPKMDVSFLDDDDIIDVEALKAGGGGYERGGINRQLRSRNSDESSSWTLAFSLPRYLGG